MGGVEGFYIRPNERLGIPKIKLTAGGNVKMADWHDRVKAVIHTWYPGQEGGTALAEMLFGDINPSGKLPIFL